MHAPAANLDLNGLDVTPLQQQPQQPQPEAQIGTYHYDTRTALNDNIVNILDATDTQKSVIAQAAPTEPPISEVKKTGQTPNYHAFSIMSPILHGLTKTGKDGAANTEYFHQLPETEKFPVAIACIRYIGIPTFFRTFPEYAQQQRKQIIAELLKPEQEYAYLVTKNLPVLLEGSANHHEESAAISEEVIKSSLGRMGLANQHTSNFPALSPNAYKLLSSLNPSEQKMYSADDTNNYYVRKAGPIHKPQHAAMPKTAIQQEEELFRQQQFRRSTT